MIHINPPPYPNHNDHEGWWLFSQILELISDKFIPNTKIEGVNMFLHSGDDILLDYCDDHGTSPQEFDDVPAYIRKQEKK